MRTFASLCTGFGLMDIGAIQAGYLPIWGIEINKDLAIVAAQNLQHKIFVESLIEFDFTKVEAPQHLHISPPCQKASVANRKKETYGDLLIAQACCTALRVLYPESFTLENVTGYSTFQSFKLIIEALKSLNYIFVVEALDAFDFCVPQNRKRLILRASRVLPKITGCGKASQTYSWYDVLGKSFNTFETIRLPFWQQKFVANLDNVFPFLINGSTNNSGKTVTLRSKNQPAFTITATQTKRPISICISKDYALRLNCRALARLQTVPNSYKLSDSRQLNSKGIGNGVPCRFAKSVLLSIS